MLRAVDYILIIYMMINVASFSLYGADKRRARKGRWRIRESVLLGAAGLMGGVGAWLGMRVFRHKTKHTVFRICVPAAALMQAALMAYVLIRLSGVLG